VKDITGLSTERTLSILRV